MWGKFTCLEIVAPKPLVYSSAFPDGRGTTCRAPFSAKWPLKS